MTKHASSCHFAFLFRCVLYGALVQSALFDACASSKASFPLVSRGSLVVFYGDSITTRGDRPDGWIKIIRERLARDLRRRDIRLINAGRCGATSGELAAMLQGEFPHRPHAAVVCIGVNDVLRRDCASSQDLASYAGTLREIVNRLKRTGAEVIVVPPLLYGEAPRGSNAKDRELDAYADVAALVAERSSVRFVDARSALFSELQQIGEISALHNTLTVDGLHLSPAGNRVLADVVYPELVSFHAATKGRSKN